MLQSTKILQMSTLELQEHVENLLLENPTLEIEATQKEEYKSELANKAAWLMSNDRQNRWYHQNDADTQNLIESVAAQPHETLYDHLRSQIIPHKLPSRLLLAIDCILAGLNENGYLDETPEELAEYSGQPLEIISQAEKIVKELEPAGVGARTLSESLALQLERKGITGLPISIVNNHLEDLARNHYSHISKATGASRQDVQTACQMIKSLNPHPGSLYAPREAPRYIIPDLIVTELENELVIAAGDEFLPELKISSYYQKLMTDSDEKEVRDYLTEKIQQASWVIKSIEQRRNTLLACARIIVSKQDQFFRLGSGHLQPLTLADIAQEAGIHESTVSRAVKDKYIQCAQGMYPMIHFFSRALPGNNGESVSSEQIKSMIRTLIDGEDHKRPLSDQEICDLLGSQGLKLSRRTVAKYRSEMGIPSTSGRKEF